MKAKEATKHYSYMLRCADGTLCSGYGGLYGINNINHFLQESNNGDLPINNSQHFLHRNNPCKKIAENILDAIRRKESA